MSLNTASILENIKKKINKIETPREAAKNEAEAPDLQVIDGGADDEFETIGGDINLADNIHGDVSHHIDNSEDGKDDIALEHEMQDGFSEGGSVDSASVEEIADVAVGGVEEVADNDDKTTVSLGDDDIFAEVDQVDAQGGFESNNTAGDLEIEESAVNQDDAGAVVEEAADAKNDEVIADLDLAEDVDQSPDLAEKNEDDDLFGELDGDADVAVKEESVDAPVEEKSEDLVADEKSVEVDDLELEIDEKSSETLETEEKPLENADLELVVEEKSVEIEEKAPEKVSEVDDLEDLLQEDTKSDDLELELEDSSFESSEADDIFAEEKEEKPAEAESLAQENDELGDILSQNDEKNEKLQQKADDEDLFAEENAAEDSSSAEKSEAIIGDDLAGKISDSMQGLADAKDMAARVESSGVFEQLPEIAKEIMRPKLEEWFNENLEKLVEKVVREEIQRVVDRK